jgi:hypothetical protein
MVNFARDDVTTVSAAGADEVRALTDPAGPDRVGCGTAVPEQPPTRNPAAAAARAEVSSRMPGL